MFLVSATHVGFNLRLIMDGLINHVDSRPNQLPFFVDFSLPVNKGHLLAYLVNSILADGLLVWRLWVVWEHSYLICAAPLVFYIGLIVCACNSFVIIARIPASNPLEFFTHNQWLTGSLIMTIVSNGTVTLLIGWKTFSAHKAVFASVVESALLYTAASAASLALYREKANAGAITEAFAVQLAGIAPALIIVRVAVRRSAGAPSSSASGSRSSRSRTSAVGSPLLKPGLSRLSTMPRVPKPPQSPYAQPYSASLHPYAQDVRPYSRDSDFGPVLVIDKESSPV